MFWMVLGAVLVFAIAVDLLWTTVSDHGGGMITAPLIRAIDRLVRASHGAVRRSPLLVFAGPLTIVVVMLVWIAGLWLGWFLLFSAEPQQIVVAKTGKPADWVERLYYVGFTISTLGIGDLKPAGDYARFLTPIAAFSGLGVATLAITYVLSVVNATIQKRQTASSIAGLGKTPNELLGNAWNGRDFRGLELPLNAIASQLVLSAEQQLAYPILDNFYSDEPEVALALKAAMLDETLSLLTFGVDPSQQPEPAIVQSVRSALGSYLSRAAWGAAPVMVGVPEVTPLSELGTSGISTQPVSGYLTSVESLAERRQLFHQLIHNDGWKWSDVTGPTNR